ncbi:ATP-binding cassette domain-containing protein [Sulfitobacter profundi]|uniref:ATP-binding cassette domain-containing protein n=1 Tax=Sulfitobacter profundi TaxID=2679961 RepID=A0ABW1Z389_9RHOB
MVTLQLENLGARYGRHEVLSKATTPLIRGGSLTALVGANAAGKSTLFRRIAGQMRGQGLCVSAVQPRRTCATCLRIRG